MRIRTIITTIAALWAMTCGVAAQEFSAEETRLLGYWDTAVDFRDVEHAIDRAYMEPLLTDYLALLHKANEGVRQSAVHNLVGKAAVEKNTCFFVVDLVEELLTDPESALYAEEDYLLFVDEMLAAEWLREGEKLRYKLQREILMKHQPGMMATDFIYQDTKGELRHLKELFGRQELLVVFYDPTCDHCWEVIHRLEKERILQTKIEKGEIVVLAIFADGDEATWRTPDGELPAAWLSGLDKTGVQDGELYVFHGLPALYLLGREGEVLLKEPAADKLIQFLEHEKE